MILPMIDDCLLCSHRDDPKRTTTTTTTAAAATMTTTTTTTTTATTTTAAQYHAKYMEALRAIWDEHKNELALERADSLVFE